MDEALELRNMRAGIAYLWQGTMVQSPLVGDCFKGMLGVAGGVTSVCGKHYPVPDQTATVLTAATDAAGAVSDNTGTWQKIKDWASDLIKSLWRAIKGSFKNAGNTFSTIKSLATFVAQQVWKSAAPYIGQASNLLGGLWDVSKGVHQRLKLASAGRHVKLRSGIPYVMVSGVLDALNNAIWCDLGGAVKSAALLTTQALSAGGSALVDLLVSIIEAAAKLIYRMFELEDINEFISSARSIWTNRALQKNWINEPRRSVIFCDAIFERPLIAAVTLSSGLAGDKMRLLN
ncbi:MAG: hypothetical protein ACOC1F_13485, partial [Myxococcota bacterium]